MANSAIPFDFPPPVKPQEIRLVLPDDDDDFLDELNDTRSGVAEERDSASNFAYRRFGKSPDLDSRNSELNEFEQELIEREEAVKQAEISLTERERGLWEFEALILAREKLLDAQEKQDAKPKPTSSEACAEEIQALKQLRSEVERQQQTLEQTKQELKEREAFVEASESRLLEKTMLQQEEETRLEQMKDDLNARELRVNQLEGKPPPPEVEKEVL